MSIVRTAFTSRPLFLQLNSSCNLTMKGGEKMLVFDEKRTRFLVKYIAEAWRNGYKGLGGLVPPEMFFINGVVPHGTRKYANYLTFGAWLSRSGKKANEVLPGAAQIALNYPDLIDPLSYELVPSYVIDTELKPLIPFIKNEPHRLNWWLDNLTHIRDQYDGDPRNIFLEGINYDQHPLDIREILIDRWANHFRGIRYKIAQLAIDWFQEAIWTENLDIWEKLNKVPSIPVDIWAMRLVRQLGMVTGWKTDHRDRVEMVISNYIARICFEDDISHLDFGQGIWHIGSRICGPHRNGKRYRANCFGRCPVYDYCIGIPRADADDDNRGSVGWNKFQLHPRILFDEPSPSS